MRLSKEAQQEYLQLLAEYDAAIRALKWDTEKVAELSREMARLIPGPGFDGPRSPEEEWAIAQQNVFYQRGIR